MEVVPSPKSQNQLVPVKFEVFENWSFSPVHIFVAAAIKLAITSVALTVSLAELLHPLEFVTSSVTVVISCVYVCV